MGITAQGEDSMHPLEPSVVACLEVRLFHQEYAAKRAYSEGNQAHADIFSKAARDTRDVIKAYKRNSYPAAISRLRRGPTDRVSY